MGLIQKYIIDAEELSIKPILVEINKFKEEIENSIRSGDTSFLPNASAKEYTAYKDPTSQASIKGTIIWNLLMPNEFITLPSKVSMLKLNIFKPEDIDDLKGVNKTAYDCIIQNVFHDKRGIFIKKSKSATTGKLVERVQGLQAIAIPHGSKIPEWILPYVDYTTVINNILAPFIPVLKCLGMKTLDVGRSTNGINRKTESVSNIVKF